MTTMNKEVALLQTAIIEDFPATPNLTGTNICFCAKELLRPTQKKIFFNMLSHLCNGGEFFVRTYAIFEDGTTKTYYAENTLFEDLIPDWVSSHLLEEQKRSRKKLAAFAILLINAYNLRNLKLLFVTKQ